MGLLSTKCFSMNPNFSANCMDGGGEISKESIDWSVDEGASAAEYLACSTNGIGCPNNVYYTNGGCAQFT
jgi:hypothetical protein